MFPGFPVGEYDRAQNFVTQETHIFSPTTIGVARFSFLRNTFLLDQHLNHESPTGPGLSVRSHTAFGRRAAVHSGRRIRLGRRPHHRTAQHISEYF